MCSKKIQNLTRWYKLMERVISKKSNSSCNRYQKLEKKGKKYKP